MPSHSSHVRWASVMITSALLATSELGQGSPPAARPAPDPAVAATLTDEQIREVLVQRIDQEHRAVGIVVGIVSDQGTRIISYGRAKVDGPQAKGFDGDAAALTRPLDGDTVFEIGSITKTFTANILADMARKGEVNLDDPVAKYLPDGVKVPRKGGKDITLRLLAQHMSGLPRMPANFHPSDPSNPYADYDATAMYAFLAQVEPAREPGEDMEYSNFGYGLLGNTLALKAGMSYAELLNERITGPLGMTDTVISLTPELKSRLAQGHNEQREPASNWDLGALAGAGAIRSTVKDMLKYCAANAGLTESPLGPTFTEAQALRYPWRKGEKSLGSVAWSAPMSLPHARQLWWHNGGTGGYHSFLGFDREARVGIVVLSNCASDIDDLAIHIIEPAWPLEIVRTAVKLPRETLDRVTGVYEIGPGSYRTITRYRDRLLLQRTGQARREFEAESPTTFFNREGQLLLRFEPDADGTITGLVLTAGGNDSPAKRVDRAAEGNVLFEQDPASFEGLVGTYEETPGFALTVRRDGERLLVSATAQPEFEVFPIAEDRFTLFVVDAELEFTRGPDGKATGITRRQQGAVAISKRVK